VQSNALTEIMYFHYNVVFETTAMWQKNNAFCGLEHADDWELILHQVILLQSGELKTNIVCEDGIDSGISQIHVCRGNWLWLYLQSMLHVNGGRNSE